MKKYRDYWSKSIKTTDQMLSRLLKNYRECIETFDQKISRLLNKIIETTDLSVWRPLIKKSRNHWPKCLETTKNFETKDRNILKSIIKKYRDCRKKKPSRQLVKKFWNQRSKYIEFTNQKVSWLPKKISRQLIKKFWNQRSEYIEITNQKVSRLPKKYRENIGTTGQKY